MNPQNILIVESHLNPSGGGVQRVSYIIGEALRSRKFGVYYAYCTKNTDTTLIAEDYKFLIDPTATEADLYEQFKSIIDGHDIKTIIVQNGHIPILNTIYTRLKQNLQLKIIYCLHSYPDIYANKNSIRLISLHLYLKNIVRWLYHKLKESKSTKEIKRAYNISDSYVLLSKRYIPLFQKLYKIKDPSKLHAINNPASFDEYDSKCLNKKEKILLTVSRMEENHKRISLILKIWKEINEEFPEWQLYMVGDGPDLECYKKRVKKWGLKRISFIGHSDNVEKYYERAGIFLMTSISEGLPMTVIEAQTFGCVPVVFDNFESIHDIIDGKNGVIVKSNDLKSYIKELKNLMRCEDKRMRLAQNGMISSQTNFSKERIIDEWLELLPHSKKACNQAQTLRWIP